MKTVKIVFIILLLPVFGSAQNSLSGKVRDVETRETLPGVDIYIPDLKAGTVTDSGGAYKLNKLPNAKVLVQVSLLGYKTIIETIDLSQIVTQDFAMEVSVKEMNEVVVTGMSQATERSRNPTPITLVPKIILLQNASGNIIDAVATQPGVSQITTGSSISKPVIRGLGYNRVLVVNDGIRQEGQQWGDEHGIEIDEFSVNKVEIIKGPASLSYGSDAMAGVINMISSPTLQEGMVNGNILGSYQSNNGQFGYSANIAGNKKGIIWDIRYSGKQAHAYQNKYDGFVYGSGFTESNFGGILGINKSWGYSHLHFSTYHLMPGIVEGERDSASGKFIREFVVNASDVTDTIVPDTEMKSYTVGIPHQDIRHYKVALNNNFILAKGSLKTVLGFQQNQRQEFGDILKPDAYGLYFLLNTINYDARYIFPEANNWYLSLGVNGMHQSSQNKGMEFLVPEYRLFDAGGFFTAKKSFEKMDISGGIRYDHRNNNSEELLLDTMGNPTSENDPFHIHRFKKSHSSFSSVSGSIGITYQFSEHFFTKFNVSRGFRSPNIAEMGSNGEHVGTGRYEVGDPSLKPEYSMQVDYALGINSKHISAEADVFYNSINRFIYTQKLSSMMGGDSIIDPANPIPAFKFTQGNAVLIGAELLIDIHPHPLDWLHFENTFAFVQATRQNARDSTKHLSFIPAPKFTSDIRADLDKPGKILKSMYVKIGVENYFTQDRVYSAFGTETKTPGYMLINIGMGTDFVNGKERTICSVFISVNNLTDVAYQSHLSRLKYTAENYVSGRRGVYNMGRNVSVKLVIPFNISK